MRGFRMQHTSNKGLEHSLSQSTSNNVNTFPFWWNSSASNHPKNVSKDTEFHAQHTSQVKHGFGIGIADRDSSSTQSTDQSHQSGSSEGNIKQQCIPAQSGNDNSYEKHVEGQMKSVLSLGTPEVAFPHPQIDYNSSTGGLPYAYNDQYYGSFLATYGPHAVIPQISGMAPSSRVPLPHEQAEEEPIYVNAKQYHAIIRRRELRAKQEAQNKIIKARKPYLHESRHIHAMKRARGVGGRFLNTKELQKQAQNSAENATINNNTDPTCSSSGGVSVFHHHRHHQENHYGFLNVPEDFQCSGGVQHRVPAMR